MLNDYEQRKLADVERGLTADDPEFVRSFEEQLHQPALLQPQVGSTGKIATVVALLFGVVLLLAGFAGAAVAVVGTAGLLWVTWRFPDGSAEKWPDSAG